MYGTISYHGGVLTGGVDFTGLAGVIYLKRSMKGNNFGIIYFPRKLFIGLTQRNPTEQFRPQPQGRLMLMMRGRYHIGGRGPFP